MVAFGAGAAANAETLDQAMATAYVSNPTLLAQRARLRANDELVPQAQSNWRPTVTLSGNAGYSNIHTNASPVSTNQTSVSRPADAALSINQPLYRGGRTTAQTRQAESTVLAERALLAATEQTVLLSVAQAYLNVILSRSIVDLNTNNEQVLTRQLDATNNRFRVGEVTRTDVSQAEARLSAARAGRRQAEGDLLIANAAYLAAIGHAPEDVVAPNALDGLPDTADQARGAAVSTNPGVLAAQYSFDAAGHGVDLVEGELLPEVSLNASGGRAKDYDGPQTARRTGQATLNVTVPLYQRGQEYSRIRQQKHLAGQARTNLDVATRDAIEQASRAWEQLQSARARILSYQDQVRAQGVALDGVTRESQVGSRTVLDVLDAEQELLTAKVNLETARRDQTLAEYTLKSAVGQLTAQGLSLPVELYDPVRHYEEVDGQWIGTSTSPAYGETVR